MRVIIILKQKLQLLMISSKITYCKNLRVGQININTLKTYFSHILFAKIEINQVKLIKNCFY
jgi:hypothetical protein